MSVKHVVTYVCDGCGDDAESRAPGATQIEHFVANGATEGTLHLCAGCRALARLALASGATTVTPRLLRVLVSEQVRKAVGA